MDTFIAQYIYSESHHSLALKLSHTDTFGQEIKRFWHRPMELIGRFCDPAVKVNTKLILIGAPLPIKHNYR